jgi:hypothetical protein
VKVALRKKVSRFLSRKTRMMLALFIADHNPIALETHSPTTAFFMHPLPSGVAMKPDNSVLWNCLESREERRNPDHEDFGIVRIPTVPWYPHTVSTDWSTLWNSPNLDFCVHMEFPLVLSTVWNCQYPRLFSALQCWPDIGKWAGYQHV